MHVTKFKSVTITLLKCNPYLRFYVSSKDHCFINCAGKKDGVGAQALAIMSTMLFAQDMGLKYVHVPFQYIEHNVGNDPLWEAKWEKFFNLGHKEISVDNLNKNELKIITCNDLLDVTLDNSFALNIVSNCHRYANLYPNRYALLVPRLKEKYYSTSKSLYPLFQNRDCLNVVLHLRRGDISRDSLHADRYTDNSVIYNFVLCIKRIFAKQNLEACFHLYSQGDRSDFGSLNNFDINFHLNECAFTTFHNVVNADVLLMSKSTFSYTAALLSQGVILYMPFFHRPLKNWIRINNQGKFSERLFLGRLRLGDKQLR